MMEASSVGIVRPFTEVFDEPLSLACGHVLDHYELAVETYGELNTNKHNAVLICHALSGNHHAAGRYEATDKNPGWWDLLIGPGKPIDTRRFFVVAVNNLGGCHGSTGPLSVNPDTGRLWGPDFPPVQVTDWVEAQRRLGERLGIAQWAAVIGGSLGGMQALQWAVAYPNHLRHCVALAAAPKLTAQNIAFNEIARQAILTDPEWHEGHYTTQQAIPSRGLALARMVGHLTYMSADGMSDKFGRELREGSFQTDAEQEVVFQVESYLRYQGGQFSTRFDANTYVLMTRALDYFDMASAFRGDLTAAVGAIEARCLLIAFSSDWRFSPTRSREIVDALLCAGKCPTYAEIETDGGHDAFLLDDTYYIELFAAWMRQVDV